MHVLNVFKHTAGLAQLVERRTLESKTESVIEGSRVQARAGQIFFADNHFLKRAQWRYTPMLTGSHINSYSPSHRDAFFRLKHSSMRSRCSAGFSADIQVKLSRVIFLSIRRRFSGTFTAENSADIRGSDFQCSVQMWSEFRSPSYECRYQGKLAVFRF